MWVCEHRDKPLLLEAFERSDYQIFDSKVKFYDSETLFILCKSDTFDCNHDEKETHL